MSNYDNICEVEGEEIQVKSRDFKPNSDRWERKIVATAKRAYKREHGLHPCSNVSGEYLGSVPAEGFKGF